MPLFVWQAAWRSWGYLERMWRGTWPWQIASWAQVFYLSICFQPCRFFHNSRVYFHALWLLAWPCDLLWPVRYSGGDSELIASVDLDRSWCVPTCPLVPLPSVWEEASASLLVPWGGWETHGAEHPSWAALVKWSLDYWPLSPEDEWESSAEISRVTQPIPMKVGWPLANLHTCEFKKYLSL